MKIEIAVGQTWKPETSGGTISIEAIGVNNICALYDDGDLGTFKESDLRENYTLINHENGADIDAEKYDYETKVGLEIGDVFWMGANWVKFANRDEVIVLRREADGVRRIKVNLKRLLDDGGEAPFALRPADTLWVR